MTETTTGTATGGDLPVRVEETWIPLADGTALWARLWRPETDEPCPALLEYLPYRAGDWTAPRDAERHPWYAAHGYVSVRVDVRGHGNSEGVPGDEYSDQELADGEEVIAWLAAQPWCTGAVGMFGISWGGFNSLQLAARRPPALKAIVTVCSSDDRYDNDVHYTGGSLLAIDMHAWAATMLTFESRPPDPRVWGAAWRDRWLDRLEQTQPYIGPWLSHQTRDAYWRRGSVCEDYAAITTPVLAVGGWFDPYRDTVLRLCEHLDAAGTPVRGIIGPWSHQYPDRGLPPGPGIDFLGETLAWWDHWLKGAPTPVLEAPLLRAWISGSVPPRTGYPTMPGRWVAEPAWPSPAIATRSFPLTGSTRVRTPQHHGVHAGRYFPYGNASDLPPDQRAEDGLAECYDSPALTEDLEVLGRPAVRLGLRTDERRGQVTVRLCDVAPDGASTLVTRGTLNLLARRGRDRAVEWEPGATEDVVVTLTGTGYTIPAGHRVRVAVATAYWPWVWPHPGTGGIELDPAGCALDLPVRPRPETGDDRDIADRAVRFDPPVAVEPLPVTYRDPADRPRPERLIRHDVAAGEVVLEVDPNYGGTRIYPDGLHYTEDALERYTITENDPLSARTWARWQVGLSRPDLGWDAGVVTETEITADTDRFTATSRVRCTDGETVVFEREWVEHIPRESV